MRRRYGSLPSQPFHAAKANLSAQQHKQAVKEAKREKRKEKMPKHLKKKIVSSTSRRKK